jgi:hypothetical protein
VDSRAQVFTPWLASLDFDHESLQEITPVQALPLLGAFIHAVANKGFSKTRALTLTAATISDHLRAARDWLAAELGVVVDISANNGTAKLHPFLANILAARQAWTAPKPKREPFTSDMLTYMFNDISKCATVKPSILCDLNAAIFDWRRLGTFTGSRVSEYAQTSARKGTFSRVPDSLDAGDWKNTPIAFMYSNFTFLTKAGRTSLTTSFNSLDTQCTSSVFVFGLTRAPKTSPYASFAGPAITFFVPFLEAFQSSPGQ